MNFDAYVEVVYKIIRENAVKHEKFDTPIVSERLIRMLVGGRGLIALIERRFIEPINVGRKRLWALCCEER